MMKVKITNCKLQIAKFGIISLFIINSLIICNPAYSASSTPSAEESPKASASATLIEKINEIKTKAASKAADFISEVTKKLQNKAYFGEIISIDTDKLTISFQDTERTINTDEYTKIIFSGKAPKKAPTFGDLVEGDFVSGLGDADDKGVLKAKRIIKSSPIATDSAKLVWGKVQKIQGGTITIKLADTTDQVITASGQTTIFLGQEEGSLLDVKTGRTMIARGKESNDRIVSATYIYVVPQSNNAKPEKQPNPSPSASPSATPRKR